MASEKERDADKEWEWEEIQKYDTDDCLNRAFTFVGLFILITILLSIVIVQAL